MKKLGEELAMLEKEWASGKRDIHLARKILFIAWYVVVEPSSVTGIESTPYVKQVWDELLSVVERSAQNNLESSLILGYMISFAPYVFGPDDVWLPKAQSLLENAFKMAEEQNRKQNELSLIGFNLAIAIDYVNALQSSNVVEECEESEVDEAFYYSEDRDYFTDLFLGESEYDRYFAWIFGCRK
jgi:hypothetical protein